MPEPHAQKEQSQIMTSALSLGPDETGTPWLDDPQHRSFLRADALRQLLFFRPSLRVDGGFDLLDHDGSPLPDAPQELHTTTRMVHSYAIGKAAGAAGCDAMIDAGMTFLREQHHDPRHGGYVWSVPRGDQAGDDRKLAYGHVFVLLAAASAQKIGHPDAPALLRDASAVLDQRFWEEGPGLFADEFTRDWQPFSDYRGMNANMHGVEALLTAYEATGEEIYLTRAGRILEFFLSRMAPARDWRIPEHYTADWQVDPAYQGNPMFRPAGTTPGHSLEFARLVLQHWDLAGRPDSGAPDRAAQLVDRALADAWLPEGGLAYTLDDSGAVAVRNRYWWPVTEAIGALAALQKIAPSDAREGWYRRLWRFADAHLVDHAKGGWIPELDAEGQPAATQFQGKPDLYHALQATLFPLDRGLSRHEPRLADPLPI